MLTYDSIVRADNAVRRFVGQIEDRNADSGWSYTMRKPLKVMSRLRDEGVERDDVDSLVGIIEECFSAPHKTHINGLAVLFKYSDELRDEIVELSSDWLKNADLEDITPYQALSNIDAYQVTPQRRIASYLYITQLSNDDVFTLLSTVKNNYSIKRLLEMHPTSFASYDESESADKATQARISNLMKTQMSSSV
jgi:hypothetical protein